MRGCRAEWGNCGIANVPRHRRTELTHHCSREKWAAVNLETGEEGARDVTTEAQELCEFAGRESTERTEDTGEGEFNNAIGYQAIGHPIISRRERNRVHPMMTSPGPGFLVRGVRVGYLRCLALAGARKPIGQIIFCAGSVYAPGRGRSPPFSGIEIGVGMGRKGKWWVDAQAHLSTATKNLAVC